jgi:exonuclease SbcC
MIIHSLLCENLLKYQHLKLEDLPERGLIGISGLNESGKSSIGESICFALFGRTFAVPASEQEKLLCWGETSCSADLVFSSGSSERFRITRYLDRDGNQAAKLFRLNDPEHPMARGAERVESTLRSILGYGYQEFVESFYLAQREITTPHPHSVAVKIMAGIAPMERCREEFKEEIQREKTGIGAARKKALEVAGRIKELNFDEAPLMAMEAERLRLSEREELIRKRRDAVVDSAEEYTEQEPLIRKLEKARDRATALRLLWMALAGAALGLWALLTQASGAPLAQQAQAFLAAQIVGWDNSHVAGLLYAGLAALVLFILAWIRHALVSRKIEQRGKVGRKLRDDLKAVDELENVPLEFNRLSEAETDAAAPVADEPQRLSPALRVQLRRRASDSRAGAVEVSSGVKPEIAWMEDKLARLQRHLGVLEGKIAKERVLYERHSKLSGMLQSFKQQAQDHQRRIQVRKLADGLLLSASKYFSHTFNQNLRGMVGQTLPLFTDGRYEHLQIDENLVVRAFSNQKRDFMDLDEISSGTQRQIMLALRLALSQELVNRVVRHLQFIFLDEPFAFFYESRTQKSLEMLPALSDDISQIWIIAQEFPHNVNFKYRIRCSRDSNRYITGEAL